MSFVIDSRAAGTRRGSSDGAWSAEATDDGRLVIDAMPDVAPLTLMARRRALLLLPATPANRGPN
jgi:hypothetical protein